MKKYPKYKDSGVSWIGEIPEGWKAVPIYAVAKSFSKGQGITKEQVYVDGDVPCVRYGEIYSKYNISFDECLSKTKLSELSNPSYFEYGDALFAGTGELIEEIGKSIVYLGKEKCLAGGDIIVLKHNQNPKFMSYCLNSSAVQQQKSYGKTKLKVVHISKDKIKRVVIALPSPSEQRAIVSYLDKKTAQIGRFISEAEKEIDKLNELKQAQIAHMVTHGLNPNVPMKDSGIAWIGQIPEHWEVKRAKNIFNRMQREVRPEDEIITCFRDGQVTLRKNRRTDGFTNSLKEIGYQGIRAGDLVIHQMDAFAGSIGVSDSDGKGTPVYICCQPKITDCNNYYYAYLLREMARSGFISSLYRGIRERSSDFRFETFAIQNLPIPPKDEQQAIVSAINSMSEKIDTLTTKLTAQIGYLKELKQRIISDAVTGKVMC